MRAVIFKNLHKTLKQFLFFFLIGVLAACQSNGPAPEKAPELPFFDLQSFFEAEIQRLNEKQPRLQKTVMVNDKEESQTLSRLAYDQELSVFLNSDINRPAWYDKYQIDSVRKDNQLARLEYTAQDPDLRVRKIQVHFAGDEVSAVIIDKKTDNIVARSGQHLEYRPDEGYQIQSRQQTTISKEQDLEINVRFVD